MRKRRFQIGCVKDKFDSNDYLMRGFLRPIELPKKIDYTNQMSPVRDQGVFGACVGFASVGMKEYQEQVDYGEVIELSPQFVYSECKKVDGLPDVEGTSIRVAMKVLSDLGVCREKFYPYLSESPLIGYLINAKKFRIKKFARILNLHELKLTLVTTGPNAVIGVDVFKGMMNNTHIPMPKRRDKSLGGHAIYPVGYDDNKKLIKFKNSWGEDWGDKGFGYLPYSYIERYMIDAWSSVDIQDDNPLTIGDVLILTEEGL